MLQTTPTSHLLRFLSSCSFEPIKSLARRRLKFQHERWASQLLLKLLDCSDFKLHNGQPQLQQPDIIATGQQDQISIEVTTVYYDQEQAKAAWDNLKGGSPETNRPIELDQLHQTDQVLIYNIQQALNRKAGKSYQPDQNLWLLIVVNRPFKSIQTIKQLSTALNTKQITNFHHIYLLYLDPSSPDHQVLHLPILS